MYCVYYIKIICILPIISCSYMITTPTTGKQLFSGYKHIILIHFYGSRAFSTCSRQPKLITYLKLLVNDC